MASPYFSQNIDKEVKPPQRLSSKNLDQDRVNFLEKAPSCGKIIPKEVLWIEGIRSLVIKKLQKSLGPLVFLFLTLFSPSLMANDCFLQAANKGALSGGLRACIRNLTASNPTLASAHGDIRRLVQLHQENPNDPEFRSLSLAASQVYYSDEIGHCGAQSRTKILCERLRQLSLLHPEGFFENQHPCQTPNCRSYVIAITRWLKASPQKGGTNCDGGFLNRHFCSSVARAFMDTPPCQSPSTPQACVTHMEKKLHPLSHRRKMSF